MPTQSNPVARYLRAPRIPRKCPVTILELRADAVPMGDARHVYVVTTTAGRVVEVIEDSQPDRTFARYPWHAHYRREAFGGIENAYTVVIDISLRERKRWLARELDDETPELIELRRVADRCEGFSALVDALNESIRAKASHERREIQAKREGRENYYGDTSSTLIYHRHPDDGGGVASEHLRRAMAAFVRAGMVERTDTPPSPEDVARAHGCNMPTARKRARFFARSVGQYRATDTTPRIG